MPTASDRQSNPPIDALVGEVHDLEEQEASLERRTSALEFAGPLALIFSVFALALGIGAIAIALSTHNDGANRSAPPGGGASAADVSAAGGATAAPATGMMGSKGSASGAMMMGAGGHGSFTPGQVGAAAKGTVYVQLGDYWAAPAVRAVRAGRVTFVAKNVGRVPHELMVERMPIKLTAPMQPNEDAAQGMIPDMDAGRSGRMTMRLAPGNYLLFCNAPGHYAAGQHIPFTVKA